MLHQVWFHYSGAEAKMQANPGVYKQLLRLAEDKSESNEFAEIIERGKDSMTCEERQYLCSAGVRNSIKYLSTNTANISFHSLFIDLHRTFPENIRFKSTHSNADGSTTLDPDNVPAIKSLRRVLQTFSLHAPHIGYCQSLNYIAGMLLLFMDEEEAFWMLVTTILEFLPEGMYDVTMEGANVDQSVLMMFIMEKVPAVWNKLSGGKGFWEVEDGDGAMPTVTLVTSHWFLTLFINILPVESVLRVWDCLFYEGHKILFRVALTIFKMNEAKILAVNDPLEVFQVVQTAFKRQGKKSEVTRKEIDHWREFFRQRRKQRRASGSPSGGGTMKRPKGKQKSKSSLVDRAKTVKL
ncbi:putative GTPase-activating protein gyp3 [Jimgerdemannia flammicorona]|uniref:Putative GTPase-activating protein gyp3 n=1 Tax=Jimgerdemannia flammicorona TaxID=994334 RepID=A0A433D5E1_9FUNG|nr:putative GTPase-activating protein gyp3 [Jimgerdemannia flammicorona]